MLLATGGLKTCPGVQVEGSPNMFMVMGPHSAMANIPRSIEYNVECVTGINRDVEGKTERIVARYSDSAPVYRARCGVGG